MHQHGYAAAQRANVAILVSRHTQQNVTQKSLFFRLILYDADMQVAICLFFFRCGCWRDS